MNEPGLIEISKCEVCGTAALRPVLDLGAHPMCDDLVPIGDIRVCREYPIEILFCDRCRTAHQRFQVPKQDLFPSTYHYRSRQTLDVLNGMRRLVDACIEKYGDLRGKKVLDVGCNDGSLLSIFAERGAKTFGIEPTGAAADASASGHAVVLSRQQTRIVIENHYLGAIIARRQFDTFYHEHPRTYSATSFSFIAAALGMVVTDVEFPDRYGGNIRVFLSHSAATVATPSPLLERERAFGDDLACMPEAIARWREKKTSEIRSAVARHRPLAAKAFPGRAAIPIKMLGLDRASIDAIYEKPGSGKIGHVVPGTRIPILSDNDFPATKDDKPLVNMAWHIADEIETYLRGRGFAGDIIHIISLGDFAA